MLVGLGTALQPLLNVGLKGGLAWAGSVWQGGHFCRGTAGVSVSLCSAQPLLRTHLLWPLFVNLWDNHRHQKSYVSFNNRTIFFVQGLLMYLCIHVFILQESKNRKLANLLLQKDWWEGNRPVRFKVWFKTVQEVVAFGGYQLSEYLFHILGSLYSFFPPLLLHEKTVILAFK